MWLEHDTRRVADGELRAVGELRSFELLACLVHARWREVDAGSARRTCPDQLEQQTPTPAAELEQRPRRRVERQEGIPESLRDSDEARLLAFRQTLGQPRVEKSCDPAIGWACAIRALRARSPLTVAGWSGSDAASASAWC
jgi:hypothetical protein